MGAVRRSAKVLAELRIEGPLDPTWRTHLAAMNAAAGRVAAATDIGEAGRRVAAVAETCGGCHSALGVGAPTVEPAPAEASGVVPRMRRHEWAATRLWEGLVYPSNDAWTMGARVLADAPLEPESLTPGKTPVRKIDDMTRAVHELGKRASTLTSTKDRATAYAELLASCASCHQWLGGGPSGTNPSR
jgi:mono/diheme cytochrome c family protein